MRPHAARRGETEMVRLQASAHRRTPAVQGKERWRGGAPGIPHATTTASANRETSNAERNDSLVTWDHDVRHTETTMCSTSDLRHWNRCCWLGDCGWIMRGLGGHRLPYDLRDSFLRQLSSGMQSIMASTRLAAQGRWRDGRLPPLCRCGLQDGLSSLC